MLKATQNACPILLSACYLKGDYPGNRPPLTPYKDSECIRDNCAWWKKDDKRCAVTSLHEIFEIVHWISKDVNPTKSQ